MNKAYGYLIKKDFKTSNIQQEEDGNEIKVKAQHDAYLKNFGCTHFRSVGFDKLNNKLIGEDTVSKMGTAKRDVKYDIRFHLYPGLAAVHTIGGNTILIQINKNRSLLFSTKEKSLKIEKSIFFGGQKVLNNYCIVISGSLENEQKTISWEIIKKI